MLARLIYVIILVLVAAPYVHAGPANPDPVDIIQPDGSTIRSKMRGDEFRGGPSWKKLGIPSYVIKLLDFGSTRNKQRMAHSKAPV